MQCKNTSCLQMLCITCDISVGLDYKSNILYHYNKINGGCSAKNVMFLCILT